MELCFVNHPTGLKKPEFRVWVSFHPPVSTVRLVRRHRGKFKEIISSLFWNRKVFTAASDSFPDTVQSVTIGRNKLVFLQILCVILDVRERAETPTERKEKMSRCKMTKVICEYVWVHAQLVMIPAVCAAVMYTHCVYLYSLFSENQK